MTCNICNKKKTIFNKHQKCSIKTDMDEVISVFRALLEEQKSHSNRIKELESKVNSLLGSMIKWS